MNQAKRIVALGSKASTAYHSVVVWMPGRVAGRDGV